MRRSWPVIAEQIAELDGRFSHVSKVRGYSWGHQAIDFRQFAAQGQSNAAPQQVAAWQVVGLRANRLRLCLVWRAAFSRTTTGVWQIRAYAASLLYRNRSDLFCLDQTQDLKYQLDDAVRLQGGQRNQLRCCCDQDPRCGMG